MFANSLELFLSFLVTQVKMIKVSNKIDKTMWLPLV